MTVSNSVKEKSCKPKAHLTKNDKNTVFFVKYSTTTLTVKPYD